MIAEQLTTQTSGALESPGLTRDLGPAVLKVTVEPNVVCYSFQNGETPKPCDIFVAFNCTLSSPLNRYVQVEVVRNNLVTNDKMDGAEVSSQKIVIVLAPNTTKFTLVSGLTTKDNNDIPGGEFKISNVSWYNRAD